MKYFTKYLEFYFLILVVFCATRGLGQNSTCATAALLVLDANCVGTFGGFNTGNPTGNDGTDENVCSPLYLPMVR